MVYLHMRREYVVHRSDVEAIIPMLKYLASMFRPRHGRCGLNIGNGFGSCLGISPSACPPPGWCSYREVFGEKQSGPQPIPGLTEPSGSAYEDEERLARAGSIQFLPFVPSICHLTNLGTSLGGRSGGAGKVFGKLGNLCRSLLDRARHVGS